MVGHVHDGRVLWQEVVRIDDVRAHEHAAEGALHPGHGDEVVKPARGLVPPHDKRVREGHGDEEDDGPEVGYRQEQYADQGQLLGLLRRGGGGGGSRSVPHIRRNALRRMVAVRARGGRAHSQQARAEIGDARNSRTGRRSRGGAREGRMGETG